MVKYTSNATPSTVTKVIISLVLTLLVLILMLGVIYIWIQKSLVEPYEAFRIQQLSVVSSFDDLNNKVAAELPPLPKGSSELNRRSSGIYNPIGAHGRYLWIEVATTMMDRDVAIYYQQNLIFAGWQKYTKLDSGFERYFRGTSCIDLLLPTQRLHSYALVIWHDFVKQVFSPALPNSTYMQFVEFGETNIAECPP